jgi:hypothetical protein
MKGVFSISTEQLFFVSVEFGANNDQESIKIFRRSTFSQINISFNF